MTIRTVHFVTVPMGAGEHTKVRKAAEGKGYRYARPDKFLPDGRVRWELTNSPSPDAIPVEDLADD
jgi:hypothetical protein